MHNSERHLEQEIQALKAEVRSLRLLLEGAILIVGIGLVILIPNLLVVGIALTALIVFGFLVSRQRRMIFGSLFDRSPNDEG